jgi:tetratricopeptide (TPR) repeat protein
MTALLSKFGERLQVPELRFIYEDIQQRRGFELAQLLRFEDAIPIFEECLMFEMTPEDRANVLTYLGMCLSHFKRHEEARECLIEAANLGDMKEIRGLLHLQLGIVYFHLDCLQESKQELQQAVRYPNESRFSRSKVYGWLAAVSARLGERAEAENYTRLGNPS